MRIEERDAFGTMKQLLVLERAPANRMYRETARIAHKNGELRGLGRSDSPFSNIDSRYLALTKAKVISSIRFENPHSLSYQLSTLTKVSPMTRVWVAS